MSFTQEINLGKHYLWKRGRSELYFEFRGSDCAN